jgi:hypothetical protein
MVPVRDSQLEVAVKKIQGLSPYLDEVEYLISARNWGYLQGFLGVFAEQETEFVDLIDGLYPTENPADQVCISTDCVIAITLRCIQSDIRSGGLMALCFGTRSFECAALTLHATDTEHTLTILWYHYCCYYYLTLLRALAQRCSTRHRTSF